MAFGLDAAINCHLALFNCNKKKPSYDFVNLHRSQDPGTGAFTPYHNAPTIITHPTPAGAELFKNYGDEWFVDRESSIGRIPLQDDYVNVESLLRKLHTILDNGQLSEAIRRDLWDVLVSWPPNWISRTMLAMPKKYDDFEIVVKSGIRAIHQVNATRTIDDLESNGRCIDTIRPRSSTLRQAGRGAFATRFLSKDTIVTGTPVLFFASDDFFKLYDGNWFTKSLADFHPNRLKGYQLMYNYCWRHEQNVSSILFCPYGSNINYINHNQSQVNVRVQWAKDGEMNHNSLLLHLSPAAMYYSDAPQLWLDFVATRDIQPDEELFMDYGDLWESAWRTHVERWNQYSNYSADYISADIWNQRYPDAVLHTEDEQLDDPYPEHFIMICLPGITNPTYAKQMTSEICEAMWKPTTLGIPCRVIEREEQDDGSYEYRVLHLKSEDKNVTDWISSDWIVREAIRFKDAPYSNDLFLDNVFRHPIGFPDELFPDVWRGVFLSPLPIQMRKPRKRPKSEKSWISAFFSSFVLLKNIMYRAFGVGYDMKP
jgi:SET domain